MRGKYRSAIYVFNEQDREDTQRSLKAFSAEFEAPIITQVLEYVSFTPSEEKYQDYYQKNPDKPFCQTYIDPKIKLLLQSFREHVKWALNAWLFFYS